MYQPRVFCVKLQLHFGGDIHEISVPAYDGAEPLVADLMNVLEREYRVPRALQHLVFHGQELHSRFNEPLSRFGIKNGATVRLVGRMVPPDMIQQVNAQYGFPPSQSTPIVTTQLLPDADQTQYVRYSSTGTQYDPPLPPTPQEKPPTDVTEPVPSTPKNS